MRAAISLLVLLLSKCGAQSTHNEVQAESQRNGESTLEDSKQVDIYAELKELRQMVVFLSATLRNTQDDVNVLEVENVAVKERLAVSESKLETMERVNAAQETELVAVKTRLAVSEADVMDLKKVNKELETRLAATEAEVKDLKTANEATATEVAELKMDYQQELVALKTRLTVAETEVENLEKEIKEAPKVAFSAALTNSEFIYAGSNDLNLVFSKVITNVGKAYSSGSGFFRAPVRGIYYFRFTVMDTPTSRGMVIRMFKNGQQIIWLSDYETDKNHAYLSSGLTLQLEEGDEVNMRIPAGYRLYDNTNNHSTFSGFLLFPL